MYILLTLPAQDGANLYPRRPVACATAVCEIFKHVEGVGLPAYVGEFNVVEISGKVHRCTYRKRSLKCIHLFMLTTLTVYTAEHFT
jgi:hypothetical protein